MVTIQNRVIIKKVKRKDGWTKAYLKCGHSVLYITEVGIGLPVPCAECINALVTKFKSRDIDPNTGKPYILCSECGQPTLPKGKKKLPNEYDHASGCSKKGIS